MINLLSPEAKNEIKAAHNNILLVRYILLLVAAATFLAFSLAIAFYYLRTIRDNAEATISENTQKEGSYSQVKSKAEAFESKVANAKTVLDSQIDYSKVILNIARIMPEGSALDSLKLDKGSFGTPITLSVKLKGENAAEQLMKNFKAASFLTNVSKGDITLSDSNSYPYTMQVSITIDKEKAQQ